MMTLWKMQSFLFWRIVVVVVVLCKKKQTASRMYAIASLNCSLKITGCWLAGWLRVLLLFFLYLDVCMFVVVWLFKALTNWGECHQDVFVLLPLFFKAILLSLLLLLLLWMLQLSVKRNVRSIASSHCGWWMH